MNTFQYNEVEYAKHIEEKGFLTRYYKHELKVLAKYWKHIGVKPKQREIKLYEFCEKHIIGFNKVLYYKVIDSVMAYSNKKNSIPVVVNSVSVKEHEFQYLNNLPVQVEIKKLLFTILMEKKLRNKVQKIYQQDEDIEMSSYITYNKRLDKTLKEKGCFPSKVKIDLLLHEAYLLKLINIFERGLVYLNFVDDMDIEDNDSKVLMEISTLDKFGYYFDLLTGDKKIAFCEDCGEIIKRRANNQIRCKACNETHRKAYINQKVKEHYKNIKHSETVV